MHLLKENGVILEDTIDITMNDHQRGIEMVVKEEKVGDITMKVMSVMVKKDIDIDTMTMKSEKAKMVIDIVIDVTTIKKNKIKKKQKIK